MQYLLILVMGSLHLACSGPMQGGSGGDGSFERNNSQPNRSSKGNDYWGNNYGGNKNNRPPSSNRRYTPRDQSSEKERTTFTIAEGTGSSPWNQKDQMLELVKGDELLIVNDDSIDHRLHTNGTPCAHGTNMKPGDSYLCDLSETFDPEASGPLYDHHFGESAEFWLKVVEKPEEENEDNQQGEDPGAADESFQAVNRVLEASCAGSGCHSTGSRWPVYVDNEEQTQRDAAKIAQRITTSGSSSVMPPITSGRVLSEEGRQLLLSFLNR